MSRMSDSIHLTIDPTDPKDEFETPAWKRQSDFGSILTRNSNVFEDYEKIIQKYEADIRVHIWTEHQMKLYFESL